MGLQIGTTREAISVSKAHAHLLVLAALCSAGCFTQGNISGRDLTPEERGVKVYDAGHEPECAYEKVGTVQASSGTSAEVGTYGSTVAKLQREATALGGTGVIVTEHSKSGNVDQATALAIKCR